MVSSRSFLFALAVIACTAVTAKPLIRRHQQVTLSSLVGDLICPKGMQVFRVNNDATVPVSSGFRVVSPVVYFELATDLRTPPILVEHPAIQGLEIRW
jgi:hypothetical protein